MRRLTIHLNRVDKDEDNKIFNTVSYTVKSEEDIAYNLGKHEGNVKKHYLSNIN